MNINELHQEWFQYKGKRVKASTLASYESLYRLYIKPYFSSHDISQSVTNKQMNQFIEYLIHERGVSRKTSQDCKVLLTNMLRYGAEEYGFPFFSYHVEYPTASMAQRSRIQFFSKEECRKVFQQMEKDPDSLLLGLVIGLTTGMRIGEITGLRFSDVDLQAKTVSVNRTVERIHTMGIINLDGVEVISTSKNSVVIASQPKTVNSRRTCPLSALPLKWIKLYSKCNTPDRYIVGLGKKPVEPRTYRNYYYSELERLGLPKLNPHCMRHTFATQMLHSGVDPATIASILGHSSPAVTLEIYSHTDEEEKQKQVNAVFGKMFR